MYTYVSQTFNLLRLIILKETLRGFRMGSTEVTKIPVCI